MGVKAVARKVFGLTVWSSDNRSNIPPRFQIIYMVVLPLKYFMLGSYGLGSVQVSIPSIDLIFGDIYGDIWSIALAASGYGAMLGIMFYARAVRLELAASALMITLMLAFSVCVVVGAIIAPMDVRLLALLLVLVFLPLTSWRTWDIVRELRPAAHV